MSCGDIAYPDARISWGYRHALPPPLGAGEEAGGRVGWGSQVEPHAVETGEGGASPLPVSPSPMVILPRKPCFVLSEEISRFEGQ